jgi:cytochrome c peroxidase
MHMSRWTRLASAAVLALTLAPSVAAQGDTQIPPPIIPDENPMLPGQDVLGKFLFWEEQVSFGNTMACGTCHIHEAGGSDPRAHSTINPGPDGLFNTSDDIHGSAGVSRMTNAGDFTKSPLFGHAVQVTGRKSPPAINAWSFDEIFWDGRAPSAYTSVDTGQVVIPFFGALESQAAGPPVSDVEMTRIGHTWDDIEAKLVTAKPMALATDLPVEMQDFLASYPTYPAMFEAVYGDPTITGDRIVFAIANYERTLVSKETPFDEFLATGVIPPEHEAGMAVFQVAGKCTSCHVFPFLDDGNFHNIGVRPDAEDIGRQAVTGDPADIAKFKTPGVRNAALRTPLFHNGGMATVADLVEFYNNGGEFIGPNTDPLLTPLGLTEQQKADLIHFIEVGLTDPNVANNVGVFSRPTLRSELPSLNSEYGVASNDGLGQPPELISGMPANLGHPNWLLGVADSTANSAALLALAYNPDDGSPYPDPRFPIPMNVDVTSLLLLVPAATDADGYATAKMAIPASTALAGFTFYGQWFIQDAAALATGGVYGSKGVSVELF